MKLITKTLIIYIAALSMALAQSAATGDAAGAERARLANQRIQADMEMRAREEQRRLEEEQAKVRAQQAAARSEVAAAQYSEASGTMPAKTAVPVQTSQTGAAEPARAAAPVQNSQAGATEPVGSRDMLRTLEQLKLLGELKDDGYISEDEFQKIKQRILDDQI